MLRETDWRGDWSWVAGGVWCGTHYYITYEGSVSPHIQIRNENLFLISCEGEQPCGILLFGREGGCTTGGITMDAPSHHLTIACNEH